MKHHYTIALAFGLAIPARAQLSGTYTVGGTAPDYVTLTAAVSALNVQGATGNVTFDIRPGTYTGHYALGTISGTPGSIHFKNASNGAQAVNLEFNATSAMDNYIFQVDGTDGVHFDRLSFRPLGDYYARAIRFFNECEGFTVEQCVFHGSNNDEGPGHLYKIAIHCDQLNVNTNSDPQDVMIIDNSFFGGYTGVDLNFHPGGGARSEGLVVTGNEFIDQLGTGITVAYAVGQINDNFFRTTVALGYTGIRTLAFDRGSQIARNRVEAVTPLESTGIEVSNTQSTTGNTIINNMVHVGGTTQVWGIAVFNLWGMTIAHNSVLVTAGDPESAHAFYHLSNFSDGQDALVRNNIFANQGGGAAYTVNMPGNIGTEDHNVLFSNGSVISRYGAADYADLAAHQTGTGMGSGDVDTDPVFPAQPDLHMHGCAPDDAGLYMPEVATDIDGHARTNPACDIGADEYNAGPGVDGVQAPTITIFNTELPYTLGLNASFVTYQWSTGVTTPTTTITEAGVYECLVQDVNGCLYDINVTVNVDISTGAGTAILRSGNLFPNPTSGILYIEGVSQGSPYRIVDMDGRSLASGTISDGTPLDVTRLSPGVYVLHVDGRNGCSFARFVLH